MKMSILTVWALIASILAVPAVWAADKDDLKTFYSTHRCRGCDLSNLNIANAIYVGLDVKGASLKGAVLAYGKFSGSDFRKVDFTGANLVYANFSGANLRKANLSNATLAGADFTGAVWIDGTRCGKGSIGMCKQ